MAARGQVPQHPQRSAQFSARAAGEEELHCASCHRAGLKHSGAQPASVYKEGWQGPSDGMAPRSWELSWGSARCLWFLLGVFGALIWREAEPEVSLNPKERWKRFPNGEKQRCLLLLQVLKKTQEVLVSSNGAR